MLTPLYRKVCAALALAAVFNHWPSAYATSQEQRLVLASGESNLIRLEQNGIDAQVILFNEDTGQQVRSVSFPWHKGLPEYLFVSQKDCQSCRIVFKGGGAGDEKPLKYQIESIDDSSTLPYWDQINQAGELAFKANQLRGDKKQETLKALIVVLEAAESFSKNSEQQWHVQTLLAETYVNLGDSLNQQRVLQKILASTSAGSGVLYRVHALYEMAAYEKQQPKLLLLYQEGMALSKQLNSNRLYATGGNYKAVNHVRNGEFKQAISLLSSSMTLLEEEKNWRDMMYLLHNLSWAHQRSGNLLKSLEYAVQQRLLSERFNLADHRILGLYNMAMAYGQLGELGKAEQFLDYAIDRFEARPSDSSLSTIMGAYLLEERARRLLEQGAFANAADVAERSKQGFESSALPAREADAIYLEGQIAFARNDLVQAREKYRQVISYDRNNSRQRALGLHLLRLAELEMRDKQYVVAVNYNTEALELLTATQDTRQIAVAVVQAAQLLILLGDGSAAVTLLDDIKPATDQFGLPIDKARRFYLLALADRSLGQNESAILHAATAQRLVEKSVANIQREDLKQLFFALHRSIIDLHIELLSIANRDAPVKSLELAESVRARTLKTKLALTDDQRSTQATYEHARDAVLRDIQTQATQWYAGAQGISTTVNKLRSTRALGQQLYKIEAQRVKLETTSSTSKLDESSSVNTLRDADQDELIAVYFLGERQSWLWLKDADSVDLYPLPSTKELRPLIADYRASIDQPPSSRRGQDAWSQRDAIQALVNVLVEPIIKKLNTQKFNQLTLLPDGDLHNIPFAPLLSGQDGVNYFKTLAVRNDTSLSPQFVGPQPSLFMSNLKSILVVADIQHDSTMPLDTLLNSAAEVKAIEAVFDQRATLLTGKAATKSAVLDQPNGTYDILHFATHGFVHPEEPLLSGLALTPDAKGNLLLVPEISTMYLNNKLVVMSACDSAVGKIIAGEGALSLTRAFMEAGASSIIGSLWPVQDDASSVLMSLFYKALSETGATPASALRKAQHHLSQGYEGKWSDPYYWSGFQVHRAKR